MKKEAFGIIYYQDGDAEKVWCGISCHPDDTQETLREHLEKFTNISIFIGAEIWKERP